jgi:hypothetical protein
MFISNSLDLVKLKYLSYLCIRLAPTRIQHTRFIPEKGISYQHTITGRSMQLVVVRILVYL